MIISTQSFTNWVCLCAPEETSFQRYFAKQRRTILTLQLFSMTSTANNQVFCYCVKRCNNEKSGTPSNHSWIYGRNDTQGLSFILGKISVRKHSRYNRPKLKPRYSNEKDLWEPGKNWHQHTQRYLLQAPFLTTPVTLK